MSLFLFSLLTRFTYGPKEGFPLPNYRQRNTPFQWKFWLQFQLLLSSHSWRQHLTALCVSDFCIRSQFSHSEFWFLSTSSSKTKKWLKFSSKTTKLWKVLLQGATKRCNDVKNLQFHQFLLWSKIEAFTHTYNSLFLQFFVNIETLLLQESKCTIKYCLADIAKVWPAGRKQFSNLFS